MQASRLARSATRIQPFVFSRGFALRGSLYSTNKLLHNVQINNEHFVSGQPLGGMFVRQFSSSSSVPVIPGTRKRRGRFTSALKSLQSANYEEALENCVKALNKNTINEAGELEQPIVPNELDVDSLGRPTGGAESHSDVVADILHQRRESARRNAMQNRPTSSSAVAVARPPNDNFATVVEHARSVGKEHGLIFLADLFFCEELSDAARKEVYTVLNATDAISFYREASKAIEYDVSAEALFKLGCVMFNGFDAQQDGMEGGVVDANIEVARVIIEEAAAKREPSAMFWMGTMFFEGDEATKIPRNREKSLIMLEAAAQASHPGAIVYLGKKMLSGEVVDDVNGAEHVIEKAVHLLQLLVDHGVEGEPYHAEAMYMLADVYNEGTKTIDVNMAKSLGLYERACQGGACEACVSAGSMYFNNKGAPRDLEKAFALYRRGAKLGSLEGWRNIAYMHMNGDGVDKDEPLAKKILEHVGKAEDKLEAASSSTTQ